MDFNFNLTKAPFKSLLWHTSYCFRDTHMEYILFTHRVMTASTTWTSVLRCRVWTEERVTTSLTDSTARVPRVRPVSSVRWMKRTASLGRVITAVLVLIRYKNSCQRYNKLPFSPKIKKNVLKSFAHKEFSKCSFIILLEIIYILWNIEMDLNLEIPSFA